jgi:hypothetical protein
MAIIFELLPSLFPDQVRDQAASGSAAAGELQFKLHGQDLVGGKNPGREEDEDCEHG